MQRLRISIILILFCLGFSTATQAQSKIAFLDAAKILKKLPEAMDAESRLQTLIDGWNRDASDMQAELDRKRNEYDRKKLIMTDGERSAIETDITEIKIRLDKLRQDKYGPSGELFSQQSALMKPAYEKLSKAIEEVAAEGKYDYVFDRGANDHAMLYSNAKFDLTTQIAKKLGIETSDIFNVPLNPNGTPNRNPNPRIPSDPNSPPSTPPDAIVKPN